MSFRCNLCFSFYFVLFTWALCASVTGFLTPLLFVAARLMKWPLPQCVPAPAPVLLSLKWWFDVKDFLLCSGMDKRITTSNDHKYISFFLSFVELWAGALIETFLYLWKLWTISTKINCNCNGFFYVNRRISPSLTNLLSKPTKHFFLFCHL